MTAAVLNRLLYYALLATTALSEYQYQIPWVESIVRSATCQFNPWITYHGPTSTKFPFPGSQSTGTQQTIPSPTASTCSYWMEEIQHQGIAAFNPNASYQVFRNVKDYGAKGDGVNDDTGASDFDVVDLILIIGSFHQSSN
jgi:glucan 1,3-beta-glucosidase